VSRRRREPTFAERERERAYQEELKTYIASQPKPAPAGKPLQRIPLPAFVRKREEPGASLATRASEEPA
jgi:hypothetical protein